MNSQTKAIIRGGLFGGIVYALGMAGFDYSDGENFNVWKFIFNFRSNEFFKGLVRCSNWVVPFSLYFVGNFKCFI